MLVASVAFTLTGSHKAAEAAIAASCRVIVTNAGDHVVTINVLTDAVSVFPSNGVGAGGPSQSAVAFDRTGDKLYVANNNNTINVFDSVNLGRLATITQSAFAFAYSPIRDEVYAADYSGDQLVKIDTTTDTTVSAVAVGTDPADLAVSPDGAYVYVANSNNVPGSISRIDTATFAAVSRSVSVSAVGNPNPNGLSISPDGTQLFFTGPGAPRLTRVPTAGFDVASLDLTSNVTVGAQNYSTALTSDGLRIFVASSLDNKVYAFNATTLQPIATISTGTFPLDLAVSPDDTYLYVANYLANSVTKIRLSDYAVLDTFNVGAAPSSLAIGGPGCWTQPQTNPPPTPTPTPVVPVYRATLDPNGGTCVDDTPRTQTWTSPFLGYRYLPAATDCSRPGFAFGGWADTGTPAVARTFPLLTDPASNTKRYFIAENASLTAIWKPLPATPSLFFATPSFFCGNRCQGTWFVWNNPTDNPTITITDDNGRTLCSTTTVRFTDWSICHEPTVATNRRTFTLTTTNDTGTSPPVTAIVSR